jgi:NAD(P)-dependent dehydrogenase (short-subunit alcohol dehydrogenase family)
MWPEKEVALITGAASDSGRAIARLFAGEGATGGGRDT